jgi:hypothetical protein
MYPSILFFETINKLKLFFECGIPMPQDEEDLYLRKCKKINPFYNLICSACPLTQGYRKEPPCVGLAGTGNEPGPLVWQAAALTAQPSNTLVCQVLFGERTTYQSACP